MITSTERKIVEQVRKAPVIEIRLLRDPDLSSVRFTEDKIFSHDIAIAIQGYFNRNKNDKNR